MFVDTCFAGNAFNPRLLNDASNKEIIVINATDGQSLSFEQTKYGHGNFTYAILEGLKGKADAMDNNKIITLKELDAYISIRVPKISNNAQIPTSNIPPKFKDFDFMHL